MTTYVDELPVSPSPVLRPDTLPEDLDAFFGALGLRRFRDQLNALPPILAGIAARAPISAVYTFVAATAGDPGPGNLRLNHATQTSATGLGMDLLDASGANMAGILSRIGIGTSDVKGDILVTRVDAPSVWLAGDVMSATSPAGYRNAVLQNVIGSSANPFADGDQVRVVYTRGGDKGTTGPSANRQPDLVLLETGVTPSAVDDGRAIRVLNTVDRNALGLVVATPTWTLDAGTWVIFARASAWGVGNMQLFLRNVTDGVDILAGDAARADDIGSGYFMYGHAFISFASFTLSAPKVVRLEHYTSTANGGRNLGFPGQRNAVVACWKG